LQLLYKSDAGSRYIALATIVGLAGSIVMLHGLFFAVG
jgi:hypothetical protein